MSETKAVFGMFSVSVVIMDDSRLCRIYQTSMNAFLYESLITFEKRLSLKHVEYSAKQQQLVLATSDGRCCRASCGRHCFSVDSSLNISWT